MKLKKALKNRIKERIIESTTSSGSYQSGSTNHARYTPPGQERRLTVPQLAGYIQVKTPVAEDPIPSDNVPEGPDVDMKRKLNYKHNNKIKHGEDGQLARIPNQENQ